MKVFSNFTNYINSLNKRDLKKYLLLFLIFITILIGALTYYIYNKSLNLVYDIKTLEKLANNTVKIISDHQKMQKEEEKLEQLLNENKNFSLKTYFEQFYKEQNITPETGWETTTLPIEGNDKFEEVELTATFKNQTTQKLVNILDILDKKQIVYIKDLFIKNQDNKKITFKITIAAKKYIKSF